MHFPPPNPLLNNQFRPVTIPSGPWANQNKIQSDVFAPRGQGYIHNPPIPTRDWTLTILFNNRHHRDPNTGTLAVADSSIDTATDYDGFTQLFNFSDGQTNAIAWGFIVPEELDTTAIVTCKVFYRISANPAAGATVDVRFTGRAVASDESLLSSGTLVDVSAQKTITGFTGGDLVVHDMGTVFAANNLSTDDFVKGCIVRNATGGNANDTYTGIMQVMGFKLYGTRKKLYT